MLGRKRGARTTVAETAGTVTEAVADATDAVVAYVDPVAKDEKLRQRLTAALLAGTAARQQIRRQTGLTGLLRGPAARPGVRGAVVGGGGPPEGGRERAEKGRGRQGRNAGPFVER